MASNGGVRTSAGSTPVPSPRPGAARDTARSTLNPSMPVTSATHSELYPGNQRARPGQGPQQDQRG